MDVLYSSIFLPFLFGLIGFVEPCSMGINVMFFSSIQKTDKRKRLLEIGAFTLTRALVLASLGLSVALIGNQLYLFQSGFFKVMGILYVAVGLLMVFSRSLLGKLRNIPLARWFGIDVKEGSVKRMGLVAGLTIPACAIPLITVLLGQSLISGNAALGFLSLFIFGVALSVPLALACYISKGEALLRWLVDKASRLRVIGGIVLVAIGILTFYSSMYWHALLNGGA
jgi:cytochrome c-type biogenesis protein